LIIVSASNRAITLDDFENLLKEFRGEIFAGLGFTAAFLEGFPGSVMEDLPLFQPFQGYAVIKRDTFKGNVSLLT